MPSSPTRDRIYKVVTRLNFDGKESGNAGVPKPTANAIREEIGGMEMVVVLHEQWVSSLQVPQPSGKPIVFKDPERIQATTAKYFELVPYKWLAGTPAK